MTVRYRFPQQLGKSYSAGGQTKEINANQLSKANLIVNVNFIPEYLPFYMIIVLVHALS
jgi:hypothetical protein